MDRVWLQGNETFDSLEDLKLMEDDSDVTEMAKRSVQHMVAF